MSFRRTALHTALLLLSLFMAFPLVWMIFSSMKTSNEILADPMALPTKFSFAPFVEAWKQGEFGGYFLNSFLVTGIAVTGVIFVGSLAGFALARFKVPVASVILPLFVIGLLLPVE